MGPVAALLAPHFTVFTYDRRGRGDSGDQAPRAVAHFMTKAVGVPDELVAEMRLQPMWAAMERSASTLIYDVTIMGGSQRGKPLSPEWIARLGAITAPTLIMAGGASPEWLLHAARSTASAVTGSRYHALEGQTHDVAAEAIAPVLREFFSGQ